MGPHPCAHPHPSGPGGLEWWRESQETGSRGFGLGVVGGRASQGRRGSSADAPLAAGPGPGRRGAAGGGARVGPAAPLGAFGLRPARAPAHAPGRWETGGPGRGPQGEAFCPRPRLRAPGSQEWASAPESVSLTAAAAAAKIEALPQVDNCHRRVTWRGTSCGYALARPPPPRACARPPAVPLRSATPSAPDVSACALRPLFARRPPPPRPPSRPSAALPPWPCLCRAPLAPPGPSAPLSAESRPCANSALFARGPCPVCGSWPRPSAPSPRPPDVGPSARTQMAGEGPGRVPPAGSWLLRAETPREGLLRAPTSGVPPLDDQRSGTGVHGREDPRGTVRGS